MCYRPIFLTSPKITKSPIIPFNPLCDRKTLTVPCGTCNECKKVKENEWYVRSYFEWLDKKYHGGCSYFFTLTYADEHLPLYTHEDGSEEACFSRDHITLFKKRLRKHISTHYPNISTNFSYLITSEYGDKFHRPHYHMIIFFNEKVDYQTAYSLIYNSWQYGFIQSTGQIVGVKALGYVCKYISKQYGHENTKLPKGNKSFHSQSKNFGISLCYKLFNDINTDNFSSIINNTIVIPSAWGIMTKYTIPMYVQRKVLYNYHYDKDTKKVGFTLNSIGLHVYESRLHLSIIQQQEKFTELYTNLDNILSDDVNLQDFSYYFQTYLSRNRYDTENYKPTLCYSGTSYTIQSIRQAITQEYNKDRFSRLALFTILYYHYDPVIVSSNPEKRFDEIILSIYENNPLKDVLPLPTITNNFRLNTSYGDAKHLSFLLQMFNALNYVRGVRRHRYYNYQQIIKSIFKTFYR